MSANPFRTQRKFAGLELRQKMAEQGEISSPPWLLVTRQMQMKAS
jgi:hypothetical protein